MLDELILIFTQFGGGPGDPANNVVRFLLAAFFWFILYLLSFRLWRDTGDRRHLFFLIAAVVGGSRELFMFVAEYGSFRGYFAFASVFRFYPPVEHAAAILATILMGYAFLRTYFNFETFSRFFLIATSILTSVTYVVIAPLWVQFLDRYATIHAATGAYLGAQFHDFSGDLIFRFEGSFVTLLILGAFIFARFRSIRFSWMAVFAFFCFFADDALQAWSNLSGNIYDPYFGPTRHCLHIVAIVLLVGIYWWEVTSKLERQEVFLSTLLDAIPDMISYKNQEGIVLGCNVAYAENLLGMRKEQIVGCMETDLATDREQHEMARKVDEQVLANNSHSTFVHTCRFPAGNEVQLETIKTPFHDTEGRTAGIIDIARDITERRQLEEQLIHSQKLDAIGQLAGGVAHDFNNILTVMQGYLQLMQNKSSPDHPFFRHIIRMSEATDRGAKLVQNLMAFSRKQSMTSDTCDLNQIVYNFQEFLSRLIPEDIALRVEFAPGPLLVTVDSNQLEQALANLIANARDAMPKGGELTIAVRSGQLDEGFIHQHGFGVVGHYAQIFVSDTGSGMDKETLQKAFEPFYTTKEVGKGTGLGLSTVYGIVKQHNGFVTVTSTPGQGTTFRIDLPLAVKRSAAEDIPVTTDSPLHGRETILVAEDQDDLRDLLGITLQEHGYSVISAGNGQDAVDKFQQHRDDIDLVLMDVVMPVKNGRVAADEIRQFAPRTKILFLSGYTMDIIKSRGEMKPGEELLIKPVTPQALLHKVRLRLDQAEMPV